MYFLLRLLVARFYKHARVGFAMIKLSFMHSEG
jgi:hypothetical protein